MHLANYKSGDEEHILDLFNEVYGKDMRKEYWMWRFQDNPAGKHMIKLMWDQDKLVGHYAVSPVRLSIAGVDLLSTLSMTTMTHPEYGGRGIFPQLASALYNELEQKHNVKAIWGFPNQNSHYSFIKKLQWVDLGTLTHLSIDAENIKSAKESNISLFKRFKDQHAKIAINIASNFDVYVNRNAEYLNWRYVENPTSTYDKFEWNEQGVKAFVVVKKYPQIHEADHFDLYLTEIGIKFEDFHLLPLFLQHIIDHYKGGTKSIHTWMNIFDPRHIYLEKAGFQLGGNPTILGVRPVEEFKNILADYRNWFISYGDSDVY